MVRVVMVVLIVLLASTAMAADTPISKGSWFLDGSFYFRSQSGDLYDNFAGDGVTTFGAGNVDISIVEQFELRPTFGYFIADHVMLGLGFGYTKYSRGSSDLGFFGIGPTVGYYFNTKPMDTDPEGCIYPFVRAFFSYGSVEDEDLSITQLGGEGGVLYMLSSSFALDGSLKFTSDTWDFGGDSDSESGTTLEIGIGVMAFII